MTRLRAGRKQPPKEDNPERSSIQRGALPMREEHSDGISDIPVTRASTRGVEHTDEGKHPSPRGSLPLNIVPSSLTSGLNSLRSAAGVEVPPKGEE